MRTPTQSVRGFTIVETMISMVVLGIGLIGALGALQRGATEARLGQNRQMKMMLADAALQRIRFMDKQTLYNAAAPQPSVDILALAVGASPWVQDPTSTTDPLDFSQGAYFNILPDGTITAVPVTGNPPCTDASVPVGTICREVLIHKGAPFHATNLTIPAGAIPSASSVATAWVRVSRKTSATDRLDAEIDVVLNEVVIQ